MSDKINIFVRDRGYITVKNYKRAAHLVARLEETTSKYIDFEVDEDFYGGLSDTLHNKNLKVHIKVDDITTIEDIAKM